MPDDEALIIQRMVINERFTDKSNHEKMSHAFEKYIW